MAPGVSAPSTAPAGATGLVTCPKCGASNNRSFKFCGTCGFSLASVAAPAPAAVAPPAEAPPVAASPVQRGSLVLIRPDGSEGGSTPLSDTTPVGRRSGGLFASDSYLSPLHATFTFAPRGLTVQDEGSLNGVFLRIPADSPQELKDGSVFRIGQEIVRFERLASPAAKGGVEVMGSPCVGVLGRLCLITGRDTSGNCFTVPAVGLHLGRERGDLLFPEDGYVSGLHCRIHEEGGRVFLTDLGSSNGTFTRISGAVVVNSGALLLMGQQLFRVEF